MLKLTDNIGAFFISVVFGGFRVNVTNNGYFQVICDRDNSFDLSILLNNFIKKCTHL